MKQRVLFICTHNAARSQMAEGLLRFLYGDRYEVASAGTEPSVVHPLAVQAMAELGIDISGQQSKAIDVFADQRFDWVITVCDQAREACPFVPGDRVLHWSLPDPTQVTGDERQRMDVFRQVRDDLRRRIEETFGANKE